MNPVNGFILRLPDEFLVVILETASEHDPQRPDDRIRYSYDSCKSLAFVCHRFNRIVAPFLYHTINFNVSAPLRTTTKTKQPDLHGGFTVVFKDESHTKATWELLRHASNYMTELRRLDLHRNNLGVHLSDLMEVDILSLEELNISGMSSSSYNRIPIPASYPENVVIPINKRRTASFRKLHLSHFQAIPTATSEIINWSKHLTHFKLSFFMSVYPLYLQDLNSCLHHHHQYTLRSIDIGYLSDERRPRFYAVDSPNLEELTLSRWLMPEKGLQFTSADADALLGPKLRTFHLTLRYSIGILRDGTMSGSRRSSG
ncbi:hypothetical protein ASPWEDRAFT_176052 [Aspergillus wentii DTO 134E9]|uniref:Uncharacterized protein n=1 Tax=Aspergillus wentii DTO 134E9 TaxID=1073089 RepID=A0A1L9R7P5_ASPWE|nr:uncharacterized protein ASPWEDRAFT_176052 [Aspergillus wentii DTO 134E9]KAI9927570.1 hypothetical protein MW887_003188 [Aspergillus wentii]OJJ30945.1 hypothetical protein ASPWEDRAFT_176052 [Aspergillus wentii DTO 134E9]